jgi:hypothetical protein
MLSYLSNVALDIYYGYVQTKCIYCSRKIKISRNKLINTDNSFSCNIGCALNYMNQVYQLPN